MPDTRTERMEQIAKDLWDEGWYMMANSVKAITEERDKFKAFFRKVALATLNHGTHGGHATVTARDLGILLEEVDPKWIKNNVNKE